MNKNIDLGTFQWDTNKIEHQLAANTMEMNKYSSTVKIARDQIKEQSKDIAILESKIESERKAQVRMTKELQDGHRSQESYNLEIEKSNQNLDQYVAEQIAVGKAQADNIIIINRAQAATKDLRLENNELNKLLGAGRTELSQNENAYRDLNKELNASKIEAKNLGAQMILLERDGKQGTDEYTRLAAQFAETSKKADDLNNDFKALDHSVGDNNRTVGDYKDQIVGAWSEIGNKVKSGDLKGAFDSAKDEVGALKEGVGGLFKMLAANPWLLAIAGIALFVKEMWSYNSAIQENVKLTETLFSTNGEKTTEYLDEVRTNISGLAETFSLEFKEVANAVDDLVDTGAVKDELEAINIIKENIVKAPDANEFISTLGDTALKAEQVGMSLKEVIAAKMSLDASGGNNAFFDALQKGYKSLAEGGDKLKKTLTGAFGAGFSSDILSKVQNGSMTTVQALENIRKKGEEVGLSEGDRMNLAIQLFGKSALAAGGYAKVMDTVRDSSDRATEPLTVLQQRTLDLINLNQELDGAIDNAFKSESVIAFQDTVEMTWKQIKLYFFKGLSDIIANTKKEIDTLTLIFYNVRDGIKVIPKAFSIVMNGLNADFRQLADIARSVGGVIQAAFTFNPATISAAIDSLLSKVKSFKSQAATSLSEVGKLGSNINSNNKNTISTNNAAQLEAIAIKEAAELAKEKNKIQNGADEAEAKSNEAKSKQADAVKNKRIKDLEKEKADKLKAIDDAAKKAIDLAKYEADQSVAIAKNELAEYISLNAAKLDDDKRLTAERLANQLKYYDDLKALQISNNNAELEKALVDKTEAEKINIRKEYAIKEIDITTDINEKKKELNKTYVEQTAEDEKLASAIEFQNKLLQLEENNATEYEVRRAQAEEQRRIDLADLEQQRTDDLISIENYEAQKKLIEAQSSAAQKQITEAETSARLSSYSEMFGGVAQLLGEHTAAGKAAGIAQATINTYQGVTDVWKTESTLPEPFATIAKVVSTGVVLASGLGAVKKIAAVKAAKGMLISGSSHANGGVPISTPNGMIEAEGGEPILTKKAFQMFPGLISDINVAGGGVPLYASGGLVPSKLATVQNSIKVNSGNVSISPEAVQEIAFAIYAGSQSGIGDLSENRKIANGANF